MEPLRKRECLHQIIEPVQPMVWAIFAENGNCRMWTTDKSHAEATAKDISLQVTPLYAAPQPAAQALDAKGGRWLTVVYRDIAAGQEARELGEHKNVCAMSWSHALNELDAAIAAQQGAKP